MKFVVDGMLGKLARWLRMLGNNVRYSNNLDDTRLLDIAKKEKRILLTRDFDLYEHAIATGIEAFYVEGKTEEERLAELAGRFSLELEINMETSRCPKCNTRIERVPKEDVEGKVEKNTYQHYSEFWRCPKDGQVYWQGAHWSRIGKTLEGAQKIVEEMKKRRDV